MLPALRAPPSFTGKSLWRSASVYKCFLIFCAGAFKDGQMWVSQKHSSLLCYASEYEKTDTDAFYHTIMLLKYKSIFESKKLNQWYKAAAGMLQLDTQTSAAEFLCVSTNANNYLYNIMSEQRWGETITTYEAEYIAVESDNSVTGGRNHHWRGMIGARLVRMVRKKNEDWLKTSHFNKLCSALINLSLFSDRIWYQAVYRTANNHCVKLPDS